METLFIPNESDFRKWIRESVKECLESTTKNAEAGEKEEALISRKEIATYLGISLVTLTDWMKKAFLFTGLMAVYIFKNLKCLIM